MSPAAVVTLAVKVDSGDQAESLRREAVALARRLDLHVTESSVAVDTSLSAEDLDE